MHRRIRYEVMRAKVDAFVFICRQLIIGIDSNITPRRNVEGWIECNLLNRSVGAIRPEEKTLSNLV